MTSTTTLSNKAIHKVKVSSTAKSTAEVTSASDDSIAVQVKSKKTPRLTDDIYTTEKTGNGVDPTLKTIMDNYAAFLELFQLLQPTHNELALAPVKTDYEAANMKVVDAISNRN
ncbi:hypothetical protein ACTFIR_005739 [Dictyostelium discoideum]